MSEWKSIKLGEICDVRDGTHDSPKQNYIGKPLVTSKNLKNGSVFLENTYLISEGDFFQINRRSKVDKYDILFSMIGTVGEMAIVKEEPDFAIKNVGLFKCNGDYDLAKWIYYYMKSNTAKEELQAALKGSTQAYISLGDLRKFPMLQPPIEEQKSIASILSSLDDKIDLLHRQNKTLEAMAETLFRQWFVEGAVNWENVPLTELLDFMEGPGIRNWQYTESGTPFINIRLISNGDIDVSKASYVSNEEANGKYSHFHLQEGDMIVSTSGTLGKNAIVRKYHLPMILNTSVIRFRPVDGRSYSFVYQYLQSRIFQEHLDSAASGSVQANFGPTHLKQMTINRPPQAVLDAYSEQADPLYEKIQINQMQIKTLEKLRDSLLPKLMSGEVRVG